MYLDSYGWVSEALLQRRVRVTKARAHLLMVLLLERGCYRIVV